MAIEDRLLTDEATPYRIPSHHFIAAINENLRGEITDAEFVAMFALSAEDAADLSALKSKITSAPVDKQELMVRELKDVLYLAEARLAYSTPAALRARLFK